jgi:hypothetical protein
MPVNSKLLDQKFSLSIKEPQMTGLFISTIERIVDGGGGSYFIKELAEVENADIKYGEPIACDSDIIS